MGLSILIQSVWFLHHHGGGRVESVVKNDSGYGGGFAVRQVVADVTKRVTLFGISIDEEFSSPFPMDNNPEGRITFSFIAAEKLIPRTYHLLEHNRW